MISYNPLVWYWAIGGSKTQVFSSASMSMVPVSDSGYYAWCEAGGIATNIDTMDNLLLVLFQAGNLSIELSSTGTPSLNGNYSITPEEQAKINGVATYIIINGTFPGNSETMPWIDADGIAHTFPSVDAFKHFATAAADFVFAAQMFCDSEGEIGFMPSRTITIA